MLCAWLAGGGLGLAWSATQAGPATPGDTQPTPLTPDAPVGRSLRPVDPGGVEAAGWRARLSDLDMDARELAFDELVLEARRNASLALALESWASDVADPGLAWTARLALRELERLAAAPRRVHLRWVPNVRVAPLSPTTLSILGEQQDAGDGAAPLTPLEPGVHPLRQAVVPQVAPFGEASALSLFAPRGFALPEQSSQVRVLQRYKLEVQPEGVSLTVTEQSRRGSGQKVYASKDLASLLREFPDLRDSVPGLADLALQEIGNGVFYQWRTHTQVTDGFGAGRGDFGARRPMPLLPSAVELVSTDILGVKCTPISAEEGSPGLLGPGVGLRIERREPGTIASELGLRRGDILVELNGVPLCNVEELSTTLMNSGSEGIVLKILDGDGIERTLTWAPARLEVIRVEADVQRSHGD